MLNRRVVSLALVLMIRCGFARWGTIHNRDSENPELMFFEYRLDWGAGS